MPVSEFPLPRILKPGEVIEAQAQADGFVIAVTGQRIVVTDGDKAVMDIGFRELRRIQFDLEHGRTATLVLVPDHLAREPRVFSVPASSLTETARVLALIGHRMNEATAQTA